MAEEARKSYVEQHIRETSLETLGKAAQHYSSYIREKGTPTEKFRISRDLSRMTQSEREQWTRNTGEEFFYFLLTQFEHDANLLFDSRGGERGYIQLLDAKSTLEGWGLLSGPYAEIYPAMERRDWDKIQNLVSVM